MHPCRLHHATPRSDIQRLLEHALSLGDPSSLVTAAWTPRVDIRETPEAFLMFADVPGVDPKDIEVHMDKGVLSLRGARAKPQDESDTAFQRIERSYGSFHRRFGLPDSADAERIEANGKHGVLEIRIPKKPETQPRRIAVTG